MTTPATRAIVSLVSRVTLAAALTSTLALGACARGPSPVTWDGAAESAERGAAIRFDNEAQVSVDVYLVGQRREWRLGRVGPGARTTLQIPEASLAETAGYVRLVALAGAPMSLQASRDPRATVTIAQPASMLLSQRWTFSQRQLASPQILGSRADIGRP